MSAKFSFNLTGQDSRRKFPTKIIIGQADTETIIHVGLKLLGYLIFFRERIQLETRVPSDAIPYVPDLVQLDYELRPRLWVECGECSIAKLDKLAVKAPEAELWVLKKSFAAAEETIAAMRKEGLRTNRYKIMGLDGELFTEMCEVIESRNDLFWVKMCDDPSELHFDLNAFWFEMPFRVMHF